MSKVLFISLGGTLEPVARSILLNKPEYVIFFCSKDTYPNAREALDLSAIKVKDYERIKTLDAQNLETCFNSIISKIPEIISTWNISWKDVIVDFTGGTKTMSAAMVISTLQFGVKYCYIGGDSRTKNGVGIVEGTGYAVYTNPWDTLALFEKSEIESLFNNTHYEAAHRSIKNLMQKVNEDKRKYYSVIADLIEGYKFWDVFNHNTAITHLNKAVSNLKLINSINKNISNIISTTNRNIEFLQNLTKCCRNGKQCNGEKICYLCMDLLANAKRRADIEHKYDDAVARLYRTVEKMAQVRLMSYGINTSDADESKIPESIREEYEKKYKSSDGKIQFGLYASYELLFVLNDNLGKVYKNYETEFKNIMSTRNNSILAHGTASIKNTTYDKLYKFAVEFLSINESDLPNFPELTL